MAIKYERRTKVTYCQFCDGVDLMATMPKAESDIDISRDFRKASRRGDRIEIIDNDKLQTIDFCLCECLDKKQSDINQLNLFSDKPKEQIN